MALDSGVLRTLSKLALACLVLVATAWAFRVLWRRFFWRVGRRLAFSYFTVGVLPMAMLALIFLLAAYLFGGFLLGHLYRDALDDLRGELRRRRERPGSPDLLHRKDGLPESAGPLAFAEYRNGRKISGGPEAPLAVARLDRGGSPKPRSRRPPPFVALADGRLSAAAVARAEDRGVLVYFAGDLDSELRRRTRDLGRAPARRRSAPQDHPPADLRAGDPPGRARSHARAERRVLPAQSAGEGRRAALLREAVDPLAGIDRRPAAPRDRRARRRGRRRRPGQQPAQPLPRHARELGRGRLEGLDRSPRGRGALRRDLPRRRGRRDLHDLRTLPRREPAVERDRGDRPRRLLHPHPGAAEGPARRPPALLQRDVGASRGARPDGGAEGGPGQGAGARPPGPAGPLAGRDRRAPGRRVLDLFRAQRGDRRRLLRHPRRRRRPGRRGGRRRRRPRPGGGPAHGPGQVGADAAGRGPDRRPGDPRAPASPAAQQAAASAAS